MGKNDHDHYSLDGVVVGHSEFTPSIWEKVTVTGSPMADCVVKLPEGVTIAKQDTSVALKFDQGKPPMSLLPMEALVEVAKVLGFGATKYAPHNWRKGFKWSRLADAALRHLTSYCAGERKDPETHLSHLAHASCMLMFLLTHELNGLGEDDLLKVEWEEPK
jgi:hypothetical protein